MKISRASSGFSLIEAAIALGIITVCLIPMIGLVSIGMNAIGEGDRQGGGARILEHLEGAIRNSVLVDGTTDQYQILESHLLSSHEHQPGVTAIDWKRGGDFVSFGPVSVSFPGEFSYACYIEIYPPGYTDTDPTLPPPPIGYLFSPGRAIVHLAWPDTATWTDGTGWSNAKGNMEGLIYFRTP